MRSHSPKPMLLPAVFAALTAVGALIRIAVGANASTLQSFFACMSGLLLGQHYGALSQTFYISLGLLGMPIFSSGGGFTYLTHPRPSDSCSGRFQWHLSPDFSTAGCIGI